MAAAHAAAAAAGEPLYRYLGGPDAHHCCRCRRSRSSAAARMPAGASTSRTSWSSARPRRASPQALDWTAEVYRAAGELMKDAGTLQGVADEGGWWPAFATNEQAIETLVRAIERAGFTPGSQVAIALDVAASEFGRGGKYKLALEDKELGQRRHDQAADRLGQALSDRVDRGPAGGGRRCRVRRVHPRGGRARAGDRRRLPGDAGVAGARGGAARCGQRGAAEAEPARHADRDAARPGRPRRRPALPASSRPGRARPRT